MNLHCSGMWLYHTLSTYLGAPTWGCNTVTLQVVSPHPDSSSAPRIAFTRGHGPKWFIMIIMNYIPNTAGQNFKTQGHVKVDKWWSICFRWIPVSPPPFFTHSTHSISSSQKLCPSQIPSFLGLGDREFAQWSALLLKLGHLGDAKGTAQNGSHRIGQPLRHHENHFEHPFLWTKHIDTHTHTCIILHHNFKTDPPLITLSVLSSDFFCAIPPSPIAVCTAVC